MFEFLLIAWLAGVVVAYLACAPWIYKSFVNGGLEDGIGIFILVTILAVVFTPLSIFGLVLMAVDKITGKKIVS